MSRVLLIVLILAGLVVWWQWTNTSEPHQRKRLIQRSVISGLIIIILLMVFTGHMHWFGAILAGVLAFIRQNLGLVVRYSPIIAQLYRTHAGASQAPNTSSVSTKYILMNLDHDTGKLSGRVLAGEFKGRLLDDMSKADLDRLLGWCVDQDPDSARLLDSYVVARFGDHARAGPSEYTRTAGRSDMSVEEAMQVLGLNGTPSQQDITLAYRKIMQQLHPDRGGNEYFAAKANQARDVLNMRFGDR